jgi:hypothetical protein
MTDDGIRALHQRIRLMREREGEPLDHYAICVAISDLSSIPLPRVLEVCAEL